jgi:hypothetical protein
MVKANKIKKAGGIPPALKMYILYRFRNLT